jgi:hypothetical protein
VWTPPRKKHIKDWKRKKQKETPKYINKIKCSEQSFSQKRTEKTNKTSE